MSHAFNQALKENRLLTRQEVEKAFVDLMNPVLTILREQKPGNLQIGTSGSVYDEKRRQAEGFLRTLWGLGPLFTDSKKIKEYPELYTMATTGILEGTNPNSTSFWGNQLDDYDQLFVEMGALGAFLIETKHSFWDNLEEKEQLAIYQWMNQINTKKIPHTNWLFFRILVNSFFLTADFPIDKHIFANDMKEIHEYALTNGWYFDGYRDQIDYYIPFAMHYYGLLYGKLMGKTDPKNSEKFNERAREFAQHFKNWFSTTGAGLPFGRSQSYRFAQSSFWDVLAFADLSVPGLTKGQVKHLALNNMRYWFSLPIFSSDGFLSIGYAYQNLVMAEGYNAPGSPYWALKSFILLAIPETDSFWQVKEETVSFDLLELQKEPRMLLIHGEDGKELQAFTAGQHSHEHVHASAKYEKYVYSTTFGFSVPKAQVLLKQGAFDSTFAISETGQNYQTVYGYESYNLNEERILGRWKPFEDVTIDTAIIPFYPWHVRIHQIHTNRPLYVADGGFSTSFEGQLFYSEDKKTIFFENEVGLIGARKLYGDLELEMIQPEPNTNLIFPKTRLPMITGKVEKGFTLLATAFLGTPVPKKAYYVAPDIQVQDKQIQLRMKERIVVVDCH